MIWTLVAGVLAMGVFGLLMAWRAQQRGQRVEGLSRELADRDPSRRAAAAEVAVDLGLRHVAAPLLRAVATETDPATRLRMAAAVLRRCWEPVSTDDMVAVRLWSAQVLAEPTEPEPPSTLSAVTRGRAVHLPEDLGRSADTPGIETVLVTGAGGPAGQSVIDACRAQGYRVVGVDRDPDAFGLRTADRDAVVLPSSHPDFAESLRSVLVEYSVDALVSTIAEEVEVLADLADLFAECGTATLLPPVAAVAACVDKLKFHEQMTRAKVLVPDTALGEAPPGPGPWIVKPRFGRGSRGVTMARTRTAVKAAVAGDVEMIVQKQMEGREFTADCLLDPEGRVAVVVPRWRLATRGGISVVGETFRHSGVDRAARRTLTSLGLRGPACVQGFVTPDNHVVIIEVNPRFSGGLDLTLGAGADVVGQYLRMIAGLPIDVRRLDWLEGTRMVRGFHTLIDTPTTLLTPVETVAEVAV